VASVRSCENLPPCLIKPVPAGSKTDLLLAKAKPISNSRSASGITYSRKGKKIYGENGSRERGVTDSKVSEEGGGEEVPEMSEKRAFPCNS